MNALQELATFLVDHLDDILGQTVEHIWLTLFSLIIAVVVGVGTGIFLTRKKNWSTPIIGLVNVIQTIPSLALLGFLLPILGIGVVPAIVALFLYALLPIVRNTYTGINEVDAAVREAAVGMGLSSGQILVKVELPLAVPIIFAGIRTAMVINVGIATLCALIASGGLGEFIFRGIALNNVNMILAGAIPASMLALTFDFLLGLVQKHIKKLIKPLLIIFVISAIVIPIGSAIKLSSRNFRAGFPSEFMEREDGYQGLKKKYDLDMETVEMEIGLMYEAIKNKNVDVISGFSTDGRIEAFHLRLLVDDKNYFPPYHVAPTIRGETLRKYPEIGPALDLLSGLITDEKMIFMNYRVDHFKETPDKAAMDFLSQMGFNTSREKKEEPDIIVGSKNFTESFILAEMFKIVIENYTDLTVGLELGFGGTKLVFDALRTGGIDIYPEYTGTGFLVILQPSDSIKQHTTYQKEVILDYVGKNYRDRFDIEWLSPLGFNNTFALMMREEHAQKLNIQTISDLKRFLDSN